MKIELESREDLVRIQMNKLANGRIPRRITVTVDQENILVECQNEYGLKMVGWISGFGPLLNQDFGEENGNG